MIHDREKMAKLFDAALEQQAPDSATPRMTGTSTHHSHIPSDGRSEVTQQHFHAQQQAHELQQAYLAQRQAHEQQQAYLAQQQAYEQQQAYLTQRQAYEQQQAYLAQRQAYEQQQAYIARQQAFEQQQACARQLAFERQQASLPAHQLPESMEESGDLLCGASAFSGPSSGSSFALDSTTPEPACDTPSAFVFRRPGETEADAASAKMSESSDEFAAIMDAKMAKLRKKQSRSFALTLIYFFVPVLGGAGWFVSNPDRVFALQSTIAEIRSVGDIKAIIAKYQKSLDKIAVRGKHIDDATSMLGIDPADAIANEDPYFDKEMQEMAGQDGGPTVAQRNKRLQDKFGDVQKGKGIGARFAADQKDK
jgi:chemotaxis protein histidine kinase CheA